jgi:hypothetical protein
MNIYKYRDFSRPSEDDYNRLKVLIHRRLIWCARPDTLNDPQEFVWTCDYDPTSDTLELLTELMVRARGRTYADAQAIAEVAINAARLESVVKPVIQEMIDKCRNEVGLACFGTSPHNDILWQRYGGHGSGVCIEVQVPDDQVGKQFHRVQYPKEKRLHIDQLIRAFVKPGHVQEVYDLVLLAKPSSWAAEREIRFVSQAQGISVVLEPGAVTAAVLGDVLRPDVRRRIMELAAPIPVRERSPPGAAKA